MYRLVSSIPMVSSSWFMRGMPSVATSSTWVSPRWNRPEPCAVGITPTSADRGRMSVGPRPSMRMPSSTIRLRTNFLVSDRTAALISRSPLELGSEVGEDGGRGLVDGRVALGLGDDRRRFAQERRAQLLDAGPDVIAVVSLRGERERRARPGLFDQLALQIDRLADPLLRGLQAFGNGFLGDLRCPGRVVVPRLLRSAGLDHHDGNVAIGELTAGDDEFEGGGVALLVGDVGQPLPFLREAHAHR